MSAYTWDDSDPTKVDTTAPYVLAESIAYVRPGSKLGEFRIERLLREGAMGRVYAAVQAETGRRVAIKMLHADVATADVVARFVDEARALDRVAHPNIVDIYSLGRADDGSVYMVMELLVGETLADRIARGPLAPAETRAILHQLTCVLDAVHACGIVHRDIKPSNVFLAERAGGWPLVKLLDFGIAKLGPWRDRAERGLVVGTPRYLAPEQARAQPIDHRADIYALGGVAFEMLTGRAPFLAGSTIDVIAQQINELPPRPSELIEEVPPQLDALVVAMLAKRAADRPPLAALRAALDEIEAYEYERDAGETADLPVARDSHRGMLAVAAALLVAGVLAFLQMRPSAPSPSETAPSSLRRPTVESIDAPAHARHE